MSYPKAETLTINGVEVKRHEKITVGGKATEIRPDGQVAILRLVQEFGYSITFDGRMMADDVRISQQEVTSGDFRGKIANRIAKWIATVSKEGVLDSDQRARIGELASKYGVVQRLRVVDFDNEIDWLGGAFGDGGSCFMGSASNYRMSLIHNDFWAIRFYNPNNPERGIARSWFKVINSDPSLVAMFNAYSISLDEQAVVLSLIFSLPAIVDRENCWRGGGELYTNGHNIKLLSNDREWLGSGDAASLFDKSRTLEGASQETRTGWKTHTARNCTQCWKPLDEGGAILSRNGVTLINSSESIPNIAADDGESRFCKACAETFVRRCADCGNYVHKGAASSINVGIAAGSEGEPTKTTKILCQACLASYAYCNRCSSHVRSEDAYAYETVGGTGRICKFCVDAYGDDAHECHCQHGASPSHYTPKMYRVDGEEICGGAYRRLAVHRCGKCDELTGSPERAYCPDGQYRYICRECSPDARRCVHCDRKTWNDNSFTCHYCGSMFDLPNTAESPPRPENKGWKWKQGKVASYVTATIGGSSVVVGPTPHDEEEE